MNNEQAEKGVLGSILINSSEVLEKCSEKGITSDSFYTPAHRLIFDQMCIMYADDKPIDQTTAGSALKKAGRLEAVGGWEFLSVLEDTVTTVQYAEAYIGDVRDAEKLRDAEDLCLDTLDAIRGEGADADDIVSTLQNDALGLVDESGSDKELHEEGEDWIEECKEGRAGTVPHFCDEWTDKLGKLSDEIVFLHARRSTGKTAFVCQWQTELHRKGLKVPLLSLESKKKKLVPRYISQVAKINTLDMRRNAPPEGSPIVRMARAALEVIKGLKLIVRDGNYTIEQVSAFARMHKSQGADAIMIDNLLCIGSNKSFDSRTKMYIYFLEQIRKIRNAVDMPIIILAHPNKEGEIAWSGDVENLADVILFLWNVDDLREKDPEAKAIGMMTGHTAPDEDHVCCTVQKNRDGETPRLELGFAKQVQTFRAI
jgi:replicative DNA helicase